MRHLASRCGIVDGRSRTCASRKWIIIMRRRGPIRGRITRLFVRPSVCYVLESEKSQKIKFGKQLS